MHATSKCLRNICLGWYAKLFSKGVEDPYNNISCIVAHVSNVAYETCLNPVYWNKDSYCILSF